jgi:hypothetical protein
VNAEPLNTTKENDLEQTAFKQIDGDQIEIPLRWKIILFPSFIQNVKCLELVHLGPSARVPCARLRHGDSSGAQRKGNVLR